MNKPKELQTTTQIIAREGFKPVCGCIIVAFLCIFFHFEFFALFAFVCALFCAFIFRNSERIALYRGSDAIIAPCDGVIKDISIGDFATSVLIKINIFDSGIFRVPAQITRIKSVFRFGLFIKSDKNLQKILNTKHKVSGFCDDEAIFSITLLPEAWNKANIYAVGGVDFAKNVADSARDSAKNVADSARDSAKDSAKKIADSADSSIASKKRKLVESTADSANYAICVGDRLGFMKYGYLLLEIHTPCALKVDKGDNVFAGETLMGKIKHFSAK